VQRIAYDECHLLAGSNPNTCMTRSMAREGSHLYARHNLCGTLC